MGHCLFREVTRIEDAPQRIEELSVEFAFSGLLLGDRTGSKEARRILERSGIPCILVPEHGTTLLARDLYWMESPPRGWRRIVPRGLLTPPARLDGYAAQALALRYLGIKNESK